LEKGLFWGPYNLGDHQASECYEVSNFINAQTYLNVVLRAQGTNGSALMQPRECATTFVVKLSTIEQYKTLWQLLNQARDQRIDYRAKHPRLNNERFDSDSLDATLTTFFKPIGGIMTRLLHSGRIEDILPL
jgi:hypothetical protein